MEEKKEEKEEVLSDEGMSTLKQEEPSEGRVAIEGDIIKLSQELEEKTKEVERLNDRLLRLQAEFENYKKRVARNREEFIRFANEGILLEMLPVLDNLERALQLTPHRGDVEPSSLLEGVELTLRLFRSVLEKAGVKPIESIGKPFDPYFHEAILTVSSGADTGHDEDIVVEETRKGYLLEGRVLRPAQVKVAKKSEK